MSITADSTPRMIQNKILISGKLEMLPCGLCEETFSSKNDLNEHFKGHKSQILQENEIKGEQDSDQESYEGSLILDCVKEEEQLQGQQEETQNREDPSKLSEKRRATRRSKLSSTPFMCSDCPYESVNQSKFKFHMNQMHLNKYKCNHCPRGFSSQVFLGKHIHKEHKKDGSILPEDEFLRISMKKQDKQKKTLYECVECTYHTKSRSFVYRHIRTVHRKLLEELYKSKGMVLDEVAGYHKCTECLYKTLNLQHLNIHIKVVHKKRHDFVCDLCNKNFGYKASVKSHLRNVHTPVESIEQYICSICTYKTIHKETLKKHLDMVHLKITKVKCDICLIDFSSKSNLRKHTRRVHIKKEKLSCELSSKCSFRTKEKRELLRHVQQVHKKIKGFSCEFCGKWYNSSGGYNLHKKIHPMNGVLIANKLICDLCQKYFKTRQYLFNHMKRTHLKKKADKMDIDSREIETRTSATIKTE